MLIRERSINEQRAAAAQSWLAGYVNTSSRGHVGPGSPLSTQQLDVAHCVLLRIHCGILSTNMALLFYQDLTKRLTFDLILRTARKHLLDWSVNYGHDMRTLAQRELCLVAAAEAAS